MEGPGGPRGFRVKAHSPEHPQGHALVPPKICPQCPGCRPVCPGDRGLRAPAHRSPHHTPRLKWETRSG